MKLQKQLQKITPPAPERLPAVIESLLFIAEEPQQLDTLARSVGVTKKQVEQALEALSSDVNGRGLFVQRLGDRVQLATVPDAAPYIEQFVEVEAGHLTRAALETLAIIAYRQPASRATIEAVRGVNSDYGVSTLMARGLIEEVGRAPGPGRPALFGTTMRFLEYFGIQRPDELPPLPDLPPDETSIPGEAPEPEFPQDVIEDGDDAEAVEEEDLATVEP
jgi:segregation and condensation protein B